MTSAHRPAKLLLAFVLIFGLINAVSANSRQQATGPTLALIAPAAPQPPTGTIDIQITVAGVTSLGAFEFDLVYDPSLVSVSGVTAKTFLGQTAGCNPGAARCAFSLGPLDQGNATSVGGYTYGTGAGANGAGTVAVLRLQPTGATGTAMLHITNALLSDVNGNPVAPNTQDATLVLTTSFKIYLPLIRR